MSEYPGNDPGFSWRDALLLAVAVFAVALGGVWLMWGWVWGIVD